MYSLLIYLLLEKQWKSSVYILSENYFSQEFIKNMKKYTKVYLSKLPAKNKDSVLKKFINYHCERIVWSIFSYLNKNSIFYGNDNLEISRFFRRNNFNLLEDGLVNYNYSNQAKKITINRLLKLQFKEYIPYGVEKNIQKIYLTGLSEIPVEIKHKVEIINLKKMWNKKTIYEQNEILDIFSIDLNIKDKVKNKDIIFFTQPLSEDKLLTEEEKIMLYKKILEKYPKNKVVIKVHPREKTEYQKIFENYLILDNTFPFEILNLLEIRFVKAVTTISTAALNLDETIEVDWYGTECHYKLKHELGSLNHIKKTNCFLD